MAEHSRYHVSKSEAGINKGLLTNKLNLKTQDDLDTAEALLLDDSYVYFSKLIIEKKVDFNVDSLFKIHKYFLNQLYAWAGKIRKVDISKGNVLFCPANNIQAELKKLNRLIKVNLPKPSDSKNEMAKKLAIIHTEFNAIHPFREGNGRSIRLFLDLIVFQSGYEFINWGIVSKKKYIDACRAGMIQDYDKMRKIIYKGLKKLK